MSTAIATVEPSKFGALAPVTAMEFSRKNETFVSIPSQGKTRWIWDTVVGTQSADAIEGLAVVMTAPQLDVWPTEGTAKPGTTPYFRSLDGVTAYIVGKDPGTIDLSTLEAAKLPLDENGLQPYLCEKLSCFQWQRVGGGNRRRAKEQATVGILREGEAFPLFIQLSTTSSVEMRNFFAQLARVGIPHYQAVVSLSLKAVTGPAATYAVIVPKFLGKIDRDAAELVKKSYTDVVTPRLRGSIQPPREESSSEQNLDAVPF